LVKIPHPLWKVLHPVSTLVIRSSWWGKIVSLKLALGKHAEGKPGLSLVNCKVPLEATLALLKVCPYRLNGKGNVIVVLQSSQWLPVSAIPGMIVAVPVITL
jgi:hypothetical protein